MEAKDTVIREILATHGYTVEEAEGVLNNAGRAIYQAGIREVVEWVNGERENQNPSVWYSRWQAKLKEWGIE